jgi:MarR family transcriptional regulator, transcriptional regulator for hemolysin
MPQLRDQPGVFQKEVANLCEIEPITISRQLDKLELLGLIERRLDVKDRRIRRLHILPDGEKVLALVECYYDQLGDFIIGDISANECEILMGALFHMKANSLMAPCVPKSGGRKLGRS